MSNTMTRHFFSLLVVGALLAACAGNGVSPSASSGQERTLNPEAGCPQAVIEAHNNVCGPPPSHNPPPSPTPTPHPTPTPAPTGTPVADTIQVSHPAQSTFNYVVRTTAKSYYFPAHSVATFNQNTQTLIIRAYLATFTWPASKVVSLLHYGQSVSLGSLHTDTFHPLDQQPGCDPDFDPNCQDCPDCVFDPGNPDNCQYGTDPIVGGCIGAVGIEIRFIDPGYLIYCTAPFQLGCFLYGGAALPLPFFGVFRAGCTDGYVWFENYDDTRYRCTLPKTAYYGFASYVDIKGATGVDKRYFVNPNGDWSIQWIPSTTPLSETAAWVYDLNKNPITYGYAAFAIWNTGAPSP